MHRQRAVPQIFQTGDSLAYHKTGDKQNPNKYRPMSRISALAKIFGRILKTRIDTFLVKYSVLSERQYEFRTVCSTQDAMQKLTENI